MIPALRPLLKKASMGVLCASAMVAGGAAGADEAWDVFPQTTAIEIASPASAVGAGAYGLGELAAGSLALRRRRRAERELAERDEYRKETRRAAEKVVRRLRTSGLVREGDSLEEFVILCGADDDMARRAIRDARTLLDAAAGPNGAKPEDRTAFLVALH